MRWQQRQQRGQQQRGQQQRGQQQRGQQQRGWRWAGAAVVAAVGLVAVGCAEERYVAYTGEMEADFLDACRAGAAEAVCRCTWQRITAELPVQDFVDAADDLDEQGLPPELAALASDCATRVAVGAEP